MQLPMGVPVEGGVCVKSTPKDSSAAALWIIGGTSNQSDYQGLQRYSFKDAKWESITPNVPVTENRLWHGAVYLNSSDSILIYAGTQDGSMHLSSQTFTVEASAPYTVLAYEAIAPPAISPILVPWTEDDAMYCGGSTTNTQIMTFSPSTSWVDAGASLAAPFYDTSAIKAVVVDGDDGSKNLYTFNLTDSPSAVNRTVLMGAGGQPVQSAAPSTPSKRAIDLDSATDSAVATPTKRDLTAANWPAYNSTFAPTTTRSNDYSLAMDGNGLVVISGGNSKDPIAMFQAKENSWENATAVLVGKFQKPLSNIQTTSSSATPSPTTLSTSSISSATASPSPSPTAAPDDGKDPKVPTRILGIVLGTVVAVALVLLLLSFLRRWLMARKQHAEAGHQRRSSGIPEKSDMDFMDRGLPSMSSTRRFGHDPQTSQGSYSSMAILMGRVGHRRGSEKGSQGSTSSSQFNKKFKSTISKPISPPPQKTAAVISETTFSQARPRNSEAAQRESMRRSSGWNRYWSGGSALNILGFGAGSRPTTYANTEGSSHYSEPRVNSQYTQGTQPSAVVPPLRLAGGPELNRVVSGSPKISSSPYGFPLTKEMSGQIERSGSVSSLSTFDPNDRADAFSSGIPASIHEQPDSWLPFQGGWGAQGQQPRGSNAYTDSIYAPSDPRSSAAQASQFMRDSRFPAPPVGGNKSGRTQEVNSDMSWLNLGGDTKI